MKNLLTLLLALLSQVALAQSRKDELTALMQRHHVPGMQLVYTKGKTVETYNLGVREAGTSQPVTATTIFEAASLGKEMLAYVALRLYDRACSTWISRSSNITTTPVCTGSPARRASRRAWHWHTPRACPTGPKTPRNPAGKPRPWC
ncbi:serine hydrolase [Hymenobacter sp. BRD67]|uniref:serine hydrolase n=1 Tax=Hymenobacter sp. BRD67 TaxID=2675877 RepID=UPI001567A20B|nr:serine hydrolase domain-containing protein [Hymenobacter sp. BRD67]QKG54178.1 serine hydrolase [Hymenobacter sp. BRD67]